MSRNKGICKSFACSLLLIALSLLPGCSAQKDLIIRHEIPAILSIPEEKILTFPRRINRIKERPTALIKLAAVGDLMLGSWIVDVIRQNGVDYPYDSTRSYLQNADFAIANLEAPLTATGIRFEDKTFTFKVPPEFVTGIKNAGINVVTVANNHILDFGCEGLENTMSVLDSAGIWYSGGGIDKESACSFVIAEKEGVRIAFASFSMTFPEEFWATDSNCGTCFPSESILEQIIKEGKKSADFVVLSFHWGAEKRTTPKEYQIYFARKSIDLGANLVLGHHPHVLQGIELYKGKIIAYSLGNYVFGSFSESSKTSIVLRILFDYSGLLYAQAVPISVHNSVINFQPRKLYDKNRNDVLKEIAAISLDLNNGWEIFDDNGFIFPHKLKKRIETLTAK